MVTRKAPIKKTAAKKAPAKKAAVKAATKPDITLDDFPKTIRDLLLAKAEGDITRISIISHTEIIINNPRNGK